MVTELGLRLGVMGDVFRHQSDFFGARGENVLVFVTIIVIFLQLFISTTILVIK